MVTFITGYWPALHMDSHMPCESKYPGKQESQDWESFPAETCRLIHHHSHENIKTNTDLNNCVSEKPKNDIVMPAHWARWILYDKHRHGGLFCGTPTYIILLP